MWSETSESNIMIFFVEATEKKLDRIRWKKNGK